MSDFDLWALRDLLAKRPELAHLRAQKRGDTLIVLSGPKDDAQKHFKLQSLPAKRWALAFPNRAGRWEPTPMEGSMQELLEMLVTQFPWTLASLG